MYNSDTELLFPLRVVPLLKLLRGDDWQELLASIERLKADRSDQLGFTLMMVRLCGCITCSPHSFRGMRGCTQCAQQTIRRFRGSDQELIEQFQQYRDEVNTHLKEQ